MRIAKGSSSAQRVALYVRVSSEEQVQGYSLDAQARAIEAWCAQHGHEIVARYRDEGRSARSDNLDKRPAFKQMLADAEAGRFDVVVVHKLDRFARNLLVALETLQRLERFDVGFVSLSEQMDFTTPIGKVILATLAAFAQYYSDNLSAETKKGKRERKEQGLYNGLLPFGVAKGPHDVPVLDHTPRDGVVPSEGLLLAFQLAAAGKTDREVAQALTAAGYRTSGNRGANPFTKDTVREIIQNRFYVGELPDGNGGWVPGKHGVLIDPDLFERAQQARLRNVKRPRRVRTERRSPWALSGLATCAECGRSLTAYGRSDGKQRVQCSGRTQGHGCDAPTFYAHLVEDQLGTFLGQHFAVPPQERDRLVRAWRLGQDRTTDTAAERERLRRKLERRKALFLEGDLDQASYRAQKAELQTQLAGLPSEGRTGDGVGRRLADYLADVALAWQAGTPEERNKLARELFGEVVVDNRTAVAVAPRPDLLPFFQAVACQPGDDMTYGRKRRGSLAR